MFGMTEEPDVLTPSRFETMRDYDVNIWENEEANKLVITAYKLTCEAVQELCSASTDYDHWQSKDFSLDKKSNEEIFSFVKKIIKHKSLIGCDWWNSSSNIIKAGPPLELLEWLNELPAYEMEHND